MKPATQILLSAAFVLTPEENWTQGANTRDACGYPHPSAEDVVTYCVDGALQAAANELGLFTQAYYKARDAFLRVAHVTEVHKFNDTPSRTHAEVLDALYKAAELSES